RINKLADGSSPWIIPATSFTTLEVSNLQSSILADGTSPWLGLEAAFLSGKDSEYFRGDKTWQAFDKAAIGLSNVPNTSIAYSSAISADDFLQSEVNSLRINKLADGSSPWIIPATSFTTLEVSNLQSSILADGSSPWLGLEAAIAIGTTSQYFRGDKTWRTLDKNAIGLWNVPNTHIAYSSAIPADDFLQAEVNFLRNNILADGSTPWVIPATSFTTLEVNNLQLSTLANGSQPWIIPATSFTLSQVDNLKQSKLADGTVIGSIATQNSSNVLISGGSLNGISIGSTTPSTAHLSKLILKANSDSCSAGTEGLIRYNYSTQLLEVCNGFAFRGVGYIQEP
ncbi:hypothetical protein MJH12_08250, partial [bacterium]|nr:hypothetical protein [bacterium]